MDSSSANRGNYFYATLEAELYDETIAMTQPGYEELHDAMALLVREPDRIRALAQGIETVKSVEQDARDHEAIYQELIEKRSAPAGPTSRGGA